MTLRQQIIKGIAEKIDTWNRPIWIAGAGNAQNYSREEDCLTEQIEINGNLTLVKKYPIWWDSDQDISRQVQEFLCRTTSGNYGYWKAYVDNLSPRAERRFISDIRKRLRYKMVKRH